MFAEEIKWRMIVYDRQSELVTRKWRGLAWAWLWARVVSSVTRILGNEDLGSDLEHQLQIGSPRNYVQHYSLSSGSAFWRISLKGKNLSDYIYFYLVLLTKLPSPRTGCTDTHNPTKYYIPSRVTRSKIISIIWNYFNLKSFSDVTKLKVITMNEAIGVTLPNFNLNQSVFYSHQYFKKSHFIFWLLSLFLSPRSPPRSPTQFQPPRLRGPP